MLPDAGSLAVGQWLSTATARFSASVTFVAVFVAFAAFVELTKKRPWNLSGFDAVSVLVDVVVAAVAASAAVGVAVAAVAVAAVAAVADDVGGVVGAAVVHL